jgi:hypothetical protein
MNRYQRGLYLLVAVGTTALCGANCQVPFWRPTPTPPPPRVLSAAPTLEEIIQVVNRNSAQIQSFTTSRASVSAPGLPSLRANLAYQRPRRLRLRADLLASSELDLGSNDELFWFWAKRNQTPGVMYCRHDQFANSRARQMLPVEPDWLIEALGVVELDPALPHEGPRQLPGDRLEIRTIRDTAQGPMTKVTIINGSQGWVLEQHLLDAQGRVAASAVASGHQVDPLTGVVMPRTVNIKCPAAQFAARIDLGDVQINRLAANQTELWTMPTYQGSPMVNICDMQQALPPANAAVRPAATAPGPRPQPRDAAQRAYW